MVMVDLKQFYPRVIGILAASLAPMPAAAAEPAVAPMATISGVSFTAAVAALVLALWLWRRLVAARQETARVRARAQRFEAMAASAPAAFCCWSHGDGTETLGPNLSHLLGATGGGISGFDDIVGFLEAEDGEKLKTATAALRAEGRGFKLSLKRGHNTFEVTGSRSLGSDGRPLADMVWFNDVTTAAGQVERLTDAMAVAMVGRDRLAGLLDAVEIPIWLRDGNLNLIECNRAYALAVNATSSADAIAGQKEIASGPTGWGRKLAERARDGKEPQNDSLHVVVGGSRKLLEITELPVPDSDLIAGFCLDRTAQERAEDEMSRHHAAHGEVLERLGTGIIIFGPDSKVQFFNSTYAKLWGLDQDWLRSGPTQGEILEELGVHFETSASEAAAAAMLAASINYPLRGAVTWKSTVGTNVASDALSNLASAGVEGGVLIVLGEDYGEGASIMQERTHAFAMKSQMWLLDPRPNLPSITRAVEHGFELSEASNTPVMLELRVRACHLYGRFIAKDNKRPRLTVQDAMKHPRRVAENIILPPFTFMQELDKVNRRWPAAVAFIEKHELNEFFAGDRKDIGIILQGGMYNGVVRALQLLGLADSFGAGKIPLYVLNVTYPLVETEIARFCSHKSAVLIVEEGQPDFIEQVLNQYLNRAKLRTAIVGKEVLPMAGEYTGTVVLEGIRQFVQRWAPGLIEESGTISVGVVTPDLGLQETVPPRPPGLCTGCPERPLFTAVTLLQQDMGPVLISSDIGCHSFSTLPPFNLGSSILGYGLGPAAASAFGSSTDHRSLTIMGDGGFWHNGLSSGITNAVFNQDDGVIVIVDNSYSAATGGQYIPSSRADPSRRLARQSIQKAVKGVGVRWVRTVRTYHIDKMLATLREAMSTRAGGRGPKIIIAEGECELNRQRRVKPLTAKMIGDGKRVVKERFGVDGDMCTGDHSCIRLSGCPSLTIKPNPDPLRQDPVAYVDNSCVGCGVCGSVADAAVLCPAFYRADIIFNPNLWDRFIGSLRGHVIGFLQHRADRRREARAF